VAYALTPDDLAEKLRQQVGFLERSAALFDQGHKDEAMRLATIIRTLVHDTGASHSLLGQLGVKETISYLDTSEPIDPRNLLPTIGLAVVKVEAGPRETLGSYIAPLGDIGPEALKRPHSRSKKGKRKQGHARQPRKAGATIFYIRGAVIAQGQPLPPEKESPPYSRQKSFSDWWGEPVTKDRVGALFARSSYVLAAANKEGGAHVDPSLEAEWVGLTRNNTLSLQIIAGGIQAAVGPSAASGGIEVDVGNPAFATIRQIAYEMDETLKGQLSHLL
jgi:hypothetical protein